MEEIPIREHNCVTGETNLTLIKKMSMDNLHRVIKQSLLICSLGGIILTASKIIGTLFLGIHYETLIIPQFTIAMIAGYLGSSPDSSKNDDQLLPKE